VDSPRRIDLTADYWNLGCGEDGTVEAAVMSSGAVKQQVAEGMAGQGLNGGNR